MYYDGLFSRHVTDQMSYLYHMDSFGVVIYEAMTCGLPVITTESCRAEMRDEMEGFRMPKSSKTRYFCYTWTKGLENKWASMQDSGWSNIRGRNTEKE